MQRELHELEFFLAQLGLSFHKKAGAGLKLAGDERGFKELAAYLSVVRAQPAYTPEQRQSLMKQMLLSAREPVKLYRFGREFSVTEATVSADLNKLEPWFAKYGLRLMRKPGIGVWIEGHEKNIRTAMADLLYEHVSQEQLAEFLYARSEDRRGKLHESIRDRLLNFLDPQWLLKIEEVIQETERSRGFAMTDNAYVGFVVHLALAVQRLSNGENITIEPDVLERLKRTKEFETARELAGALSGRLSIDIPESEIGYITMHLLGAKSGNVMEGDFDYSLIEDYVNGMILAMEKELKLSLTGDDALVHNLTTHLISAVKRIELGMPVRNPLLQHVKEEYPEIFEATRKAALLMERQLGMPVPEEEIGYLAMHFGSAILKRREGGAARYRTVVVCSSGIGASQLLLAQLKKSFPQLQVVGTVPLFQLADWLRRHPPVDLVLSTLPVPLETPGTERVVVVSPFLTEADARSIRECLHGLGGMERRRASERTDIEQAVEQVNRYGKALAALMSGVMVADVGPVPDKRGLMQYALEFVREHFDVRDMAVLRRDLEKREALGPVLLEEERLAMLHCRSEGIGEMAVCVFRLAGEVNWAHGGLHAPVRTVLTMLGPLEAPKEYFELVGEISAALVEEEDFAGRLANEPPHLARESLRFVLKKGYVKLAGAVLR